MEINQIHKNVVLTVDPITNVVNIEVTQVISPPVILEVSEVGRKGDQGVKGDTGNDGLSAYQIAINNGTFVGTELEFATMLGSIDEKLDKSTYTGTAQDLDDAIKAVQSPDTVTKYGEIQLAGLSVTILAGAFEWRFNQVVFDNDLFENTVASATDGFYRSDLLQVTNDNIIRIKTGTEDTVSSSVPSPDAGFLPIGSINIFGASIANTEVADIETINLFGNGGATDYLEVGTKAANLIIHNATSLTGFTIDVNNIFHGKDFYIRNDTLDKLTLKSSVGSNNVRFYFSGSDLIIPRFNNAHFKFLGNGEFGGIGYMTFVGIIPDFSPYEKIVDNDEKLLTKVDKEVGKSLISDTEITKLATVQTGATANSTDAQLRDRSTHTGVQAISTVTGLQGELDARIIDTQIEINANTSISNTWNAKTILFTANCTITVPATLLSQLGFVFRTLAGVTVTWAITAPFTWETTPTTTPEKTTGSFMRRGSTNTILLDF